ncbi:hypothetical protein [Chryseobacterium sp.]|uniref:hypothetical protein n=1 Tax=Chryseobacterium sp. TaxID=1871047 RepID=UPI0031DE618D
MPKDFKHPVLPKDMLLSLKCSTLADAIGELNVELGEFREYFRKNPEVCLVNPIMGELSFSEWMIFHNCHFTHHYNQFGLLFYKEKEVNLLRTK